MIIEILNIYLYNRKLKFGHFTPFFNYKKKLYEPTTQKQKFISKVNLYSKPGFWYTKINLRQKSINVQRKKDRLKPNQ